MPTTITLSGFKEFEQKCKNLPAILLEELDGEVEDAARVWASLAKRDAPKDQGVLVGQISSTSVVNHTAESVSSSDHSAYLEWGTRTKVHVPAELQAYASQFRGAKGGNAKEFIFAWCKRKGIPEQFWYVVYRSIMIKGINPHPYFFIQFPIVEKQFIGNCRKILNTEH